MKHNVEHNDSSRCNRTMGFTVECKVHFKNGRCGRKRMRKGEAPVPCSVEPGRIPRISRLMALALRFEGLLKQGAAHDYADLARLGLVSRTRVTQIMNLLYLAPDIQEEILFLPRTIVGREPISERHVRSVTTVLEWDKQRRMWIKLKERLN